MRLDIAQNASIRGMRVDGVDLFSVLDFIAYVCPDLGSPNVRQTWHRLENELSLNVVTKCHHCKFTGERQRNTPCMTILGLQKLLLILGSKAAVELRDRVLECFNRVLAGDRTLIREIAVNAADTGRCSRSRGRRWRSRRRRKSRIGRGAVGDWRTHGAGAGRAPARAEAYFVEYQ